MKVNQHRQDLLGLRMKNAHRHGIRLGIERVIPHFGAINGLGHQGFGDIGQGLACVDDVGLKAIRQQLGQDFVIEYVQIRLYGGLYRALCHGRALFLCRQPV